MPKIRNETSCGQNKVHSGFIVMNSNDQSKDETVAMYRA